LYYEDDVRASFLRYKFAGATAYADVYGEIMSKSIDEYKISCDIITWIPLSRRRLKSRGYDQAELIAGKLAELRGIKCVKLLEKTRHTKAQSKTGSAEKRHANISGAYRAVNPKETVGKHILLVDDIVTTGATVSEAAAVLKSAGASELTVLSLARKRD